MFNITVNLKDKTQNLYPNRTAPPAFSGDYCILQGGGVMNVIPLAEVDYITHENQPNTEPEPSEQP